MVVVGGVLSLTSTVLLSTFVVVATLVPMLSVNVEVCMVIARPVAAASSLTWTSYSTKIAVAVFNKRLRSPPLAGSEGKLSSSETVTSVIEVIVTLLFDTPSEVAISP